MKREIKKKFKKLRKIRRNKFFYLNSGSDFFHRSMFCLKMELQIDVVTQKKMEKCVAKPGHLPESARPSFWLWKPGEFSRESGKTVPWLAYLLILCFPSFPPPPVSLFKLRATMWPWAKQKSDETTEFADAAAPNRILPIRYELLFDWRVQLEFSSPPDGKSHLPKHLRESLRSPFLLPLWFFSPSFREVSKVIIEIFLSTEFICEPAKTSNGPFVASQTLIVVIIIIIIS